MSLSHSRFQRRCFDASVDIQSPLDWVEWQSTFHHQSSEAWVDISRISVKPEQLHFATAQHNLLRTVSRHGISNIIHPARVSRVFVLTNAPSIEGLKGDESHPGQIVRGSTITCTRLHEHPDASPKGRAVMPPTSLDTDTQIIPHLSRCESACGSLQHM